MNPVFLKETKDGIVVEIYVASNGKKSEILGEYNGRLKIRIHAPPVDGKANEELLKFLAEHFQLRKKQVQLISGETSRQKSVLLLEAKMSTIVLNLKL